MAEPFIGEIRIFGFNFAPRGWADCNGQLLPISQHSALFSLLGTTYGGDGRTTFALPDLRGRTAIHNGAGPGLTNVSLGEQGGAEQVTLTTANVPLAAHTHTATLNAEATVGSTSSPANNMLSIAGGTSVYAPSGATPNLAMAPDSVTVAANAATTGTPFDNRGPFLGVRFCIALIGLYPSRS